MAGQEKTVTPPAKLASKWEEYFKNDNKENVLVENSTGYQLYAVNEQTIDIDSLINIQKITSNYISDNILNLQLADAAYNSSVAITRQ